MIDIGVTAPCIDHRFEDLQQWHTRQYWITNTHEIFDEMHRLIYIAGEIPAVDFEDEEEVNFFMMDVMSNIAYLPKAYNPTLIDVVLRDAEAYLSVNFSELQRYLWRNAVGELVKHFYANQHYDLTTAVHKYDFDSMLGGNIVMKLYGQ